MLAGGIGNICADQMQKARDRRRSEADQVGGPARTSVQKPVKEAQSMASASLDADPTSRPRSDNPEMERRCQEVIDRCWQLGDANLIRSSTTGARV